MTKYMESSMNLRKILAVSILSVVVFITGCRSNPLMNIENAPIDAAEGSLNLSQVTKAIKGAAVSLGWQTSTKKPGHIVATLAVRKHVAVVDIKYTTKSYSITYKDSVELKYDGTNIHSNYNNWVKNLDNRIRIQINSL